MGSSSRRTSGYNATTDCRQDDCVVAQVQRDPLEVWGEALLLSGHRDQAKKHFAIAERRS